MKEFDTIELTAYSEHENEIDNILRDVDKYSFIQKVKKVESEYLAKEPGNYKVKRFSRSIFYYAAAAMLILLIGVGGMIKFNIFSSTIDCESIFNEYYLTYQSDVTNRSDENLVQNLYLAVLAYEGKDYDKAIELFSKVSESDESIIMAHFYKGISCVEISDYKQAIESFNKVLINTKNPYYAQSHWYSALTWIKLNNINSAKVHLDWLIKNDRHYGSKAKEILSKVN